jgi:hypothetical protein
VRYDRSARSVGGLPACPNSKFRGEVRESRVQRVKLAHCKLVIDALFTPGEIGSSSNSGK